MAIPVYVSGTGTVNINHSSYTVPVKKITKVDLYCVRSEANTTIHVDY